MNLKSLGNLGTLTQVKPNSPKVTQVKRVSSSQPPEIGPKQDPQAYQNAKNKQAQDFQGKGTVKGQLSNLAVLSGQGDGNQTIQSKRVQSAQHAPVDNRIGGFFQKMKQASVNASVPRQVSSLASELETAAPNQSYQNQSQAEPLTSSRPIEPVQRISSPQDQAQSSRLASPQKADSRQAPVSISKTPYATAPEPAKPVLATQNITDKQAEQASKAFQTNLKNSLKSKPPTSPEGKYYRLTKLLNEYAVYKKTGGGPLAGDADALRVIESNLHFMKQEVTKLAQNPKVQKVFQDARSQALTSTFGSNYQQSAQKYANHLLSDSFQSELSTLSPPAQKAEMSKAMLKLSSLDPKLAEQTLKKLVVKNMESQFQSQLKAGNSKASSGLQKTVERQFADFIKDNYPHLSKTDAAKTLQTEFAKRLSTMLKNDPQAFKKMMSAQGFTDAMKDIGQALKNAPGIPASLASEADDIVKGMTKSTVHSKLMSKAALFTGIYGLSQAKNSEQVMSGLSSVMEGSSKLSAIGHLAGLANDAKLMKGLIQLGSLGPIGEALGVAADVMGAIRESGNEDAVGMVAKITSAAAGTAGAIAGIAILAGASGPAAPLVAAGAAVVGLGAAAADVFFAESDKTGELRATLRDVGISTSMAEVYKKVDASLGVVWDDPQQMHSEFTKLKTPMERAAFINRVLDRKSIWVSSGRADMVVGMLNSLTNSELKEVTQNGLHTGMLGRTLGEFPAASAKILTRLDEAWKKGDTQMAKQVNQFIKGVFDGDHHDSFKAIMRAKKSKAIVEKMSPNQVKDLILHLGKSKTSANSKERFGVAYTEHGQSLFYLLNNTSWDQFNAIFGGDDGYKMADQLRHQIAGGDSEHLGLEGKIAAWATDSRTSPKARSNILKVFSAQLLASNGSNASKLADGFIGLVKDDQLKALPTQIRNRLHLAYQYGNSYSDKNYDRLKKVAPEVQVK